MTVGIIGGGNISRMGSAQEVAKFFDLLRSHCRGKVSDQKLSLITKELYSGSIRPAQFDAMEDAWREAFGVLRNVSSRSSDLSEFTSEVAKTKVDTAALNLADAFSEYFTILMNAIDGARFEIKEFGADPRIRIGVTEIPDYLETENRSDQEYDDLEGPPFWMRNNFEADA